MANDNLNAFPDIFLGIVSFVGIDTSPIIEELENCFKLLAYEPVHIKITDAFPDIAHKLGLSDLDDIKKGDRIEAYIKFGNKMREKFGNDFWAKYAVSDIYHQRHSPAKTGMGKVWIIDQFKTEDELNFIKSVYGRAFFQFSIYSARDRRVDYIAKRKAQANYTRDAFPFRAEAEKLVNQDYKENKSYGQKLGKIFQFGDVIINADNIEEHPIHEQVKRFTELLFNSNKYSPNRMEYGMYQAHSAALRSLDLSRQVGAAIFRCTGEVATLGCNEVPKAGGGTYWTDEKYDAREYTKGSDSNDVRKQELLSELETILKEGCGNEVEEKTLRAIIKRKKKELEDSQFMDALEYGRIVHAEMNAITDASRLGISLQDAILYCTTFPCHMCSKLIIASGLKKVIFLEPYPKSLTSDMHPDSVKIEGASREQYQKYPAVNFSHFYGITPHRYSEFFGRGKRKADGKFQSHKNGKKVPIFAPYDLDFRQEERTAQKFTEYLLPPPELVGDIATLYEQWGIAP